MKRELLEKKYPVGTRVRVMRARWFPSIREESELGTVTEIDYFGDLLVKLDSNERIFLTHGADRFSVVFHQ